MRKPRRARDAASERAATKRRVDADGPVDPSGGLSDGTIVAGRFLIERLAGVGGMGAVYRAHDQLTGVPVALKVLAAGMVAGEDQGRFFREASLLSKLQHPRIVRHVADGMMGPGRPYLVMEWLDGEDLAMRLARGSLSPDEGTRVILRAAEGLAAAHRAGFIHRDVKPSNLFLVGREIDGLKVLDFGIARHATESVVAFTQTGAVIGTPSYMAPEQARGETGLDARTDVFALGAVFFHCLAGRPPFVGVTEEEVRARVLTDDAPRLGRLVEGVSAEIESLVSRMLSRARDERPPDAAAVGLTLGALLGGAGPRPAAISVSREEQRTLSVVALASGGDAALDRSARATAERLVASYGGRVAAAGDHIALTFGGDHAAGELARRAAKCALALAAVLPNAAIGVATGSGSGRDLASDDAVFQRALRLARDPAPTTSRVRADDATIQLAPDCFETTQKDDGVFVGRERELALLEGIFAECTSADAARAVVVTGGPGIGKSRFAEELVEALRRRAPNTTVLLGRGDSLGMGAPFSLIGPLIRNHVDLDPGEPVERLRSKLHETVAALPLAAEPGRTAQLLGEIMGLPPAADDDDALLAARGDPLLLGDGMRAAWEDWLLALCQRGPLLLVLDDLQWADVPSLKFVASALRVLANRPMLVVALARPEAERQIPALWADHEPETITLGALRRDAGLRLIAKVTAGAVDEARAADLLARSGGNPFVLRELLRAEGDRPGERLPEGTQALLQFRLDALGPEAKRVLRAASVFGDAFWPGGVASLLGGGATERELVERTFPALLQRHLIVRRKTSRIAGETELAFCHALMREAAFAMLPDAERSRAHRHAGQWLEGAGETDAIALAEHYQRGGDPERAASWYRRGAENALQGADLDRAIDWAERAGATERDAGTLAALRRLQADAYYWRGELETSEARAVEAANATTRGTVEWFLAVAKILRAAGQRSGNDRVSDWLQRAGEVDAAPEALSGQLLCMARGGGQLVNAGWAKEVLSCEARIAELAPEGTPVDWAAAGALARFRSKLAFNRNEVWRALDMERAVKAAADRLVDVRGGCESSVLIGSIMAVVGHFERAKQMIDGALPAARRLGVRYLETWGLYVLGKVQALGGDAAAARAVLADVISAAGVSPRIVAGSHVYLGLTADLAGNAALGEQEARATLDMKPPMPVRVGALSVLARSLLATGRTSEARAAAEEAVSHIDLSAGLEEFGFLGHLTCAEVYLADGESERASTILSDLRKRLETIAAGFREPVERDWFLNGHPYHQRILELAGREGV